MMYTQSEITKFKGNSKHLHKLIAEVTGSKVENPLPEGLSDEDLVEHLANVSHKKNWKHQRQIE